MNGKQPTQMSEEFKWSMQKTQRCSHTREKTAESDTVAGDQALKGNTQVCLTCKVKGFHIKHVKEHLSDSHKLMSVKLSPVCTS